ncbi:hypothetical protein Fmac_014772 [Flemingia macrophylla]|uniref:Uncharacterized protein n=1 Tax=Flemingia macrophylla TaxID=520843 RepID=A0ABD1MCR7_9FABA
MVHHDALGHAPPRLISVVDLFLGPLIVFSEVAEMVLMLPVSDRNGGGEGRSAGGSDVRLAVEECIMCMNLWHALISDRERDGDVDGDLERDEVLASGEFDYKAEEGYVNYNGGGQMRDGATENDLVFEEEREMATLGLKKKKRMKKKAWRI